MLQLHTIVPSKKKRKRVGRGGSRGQQSGRGHKGQTGRSGGTIRAGFEGGQTPLIRRLPKQGFSNARFKKVVEIISTDTLNKSFDDGSVVTKELLIERGIINPKKKKVFTLKVLAKGAMTKKITVKADAFSKEAAGMIERAGGKAEILVNEE